MLLSSTLSHCYFISTTTLSIFPVTCTKLFTQTVPDLWNSYTLEVLGQVKFCTSRNWAKTHSQLQCIHKESSWNSNSTTIALDQPQPDCPTILVLLSSILQPPLSKCTFHKEKIGTSQKCYLNCIYFCFYLLKLTTSEFSKPAITLSWRKVSVIAT
jgi:hypothetical protein